ncbi:MAG: type III pantothenate kinase [Oscillospiraceae bacterium]|jgi:type III pantothenate kinase|nr:type III pantothenate kinase [Oscillospiraceae bacterium]
MILAVDLNNTSTVFAVMDAGKARLISRLATDKARTADEYAVLLALSFRQRDFELRQVEGAIISSVVPSLTAVIREAVRIATGHTALVIGPGVRTGLNIRLDDPAELGGDFVASAVAAIADYPLPCVLVVLGTAIAMGILDRSGSYVGGIIGPGPMVSQVALARGVAMLSNVSVSPTPQVICRSTNACVQSGLINGSAAMIDGLLERIEDELGERVSVVAWGDWADTILPRCRRKGIISDKELLMRGLWTIYGKNRRA